MLNAQLPVSPQHLQKDAAAAGSADARGSRAEHALRGLAPLGQAAQLQLRGDVQPVRRAAVRAVQGGVQQQLHRAAGQVALPHVAACGRRGEEGLSED